MDLIGLMPPTHPEVSVSQPRTNAAPSACLSNKVAAGELGMTGAASRSSKRDARKVVDNRNRQIARQLSS
jgi:hypothetical protein